MRPTGSITKVPCGDKFMNAQVTTLTTCFCSKAITHHTKSPPKLGSNVYKYTPRSSWARFPVYASAWSAWVVHSPRSGRFSEWCLELKVLSVHALAYTKSRGKSHINIWKETQTPHRRPTFVGTISRHHPSETRASVWVALDCHVLHHTHWHRALTAKSNDLGPAYQALFETLDAYQKLGGRQKTYIHGLDWTGAYRLKQNVLEIIFKDLTCVHREGMCCTVEVYWNLQYEKGMPQDTGTMPEHLLHVRWMRLWWAAVNTSKSTQICILN